MDLQLDTVIHFFNFAAMQMQNTITQGLLNAAMFLMLNNKCINIILEQQSRINILHKFMFYDLRNCIQVEHRDGLDFDHAGLQ